MRVAASLRRHRLRVIALAVVAVVAVLAGLLVYRYSVSWPKGTLDSTKRSADGVWEIRTYWAQIGLGPDAAVFWVSARNMRAGMRPRIVFVGDDSTEARFSDVHTIRVIEYDTNEVTHIDLRTAKTVIVPRPSPTFWFEAPVFEAVFAGLLALAAGAACVIAVPATVKFLGLR